MSYGPTLPNPWTAPNTLAVPVAGGVRFFSTDGSVPACSLSATDAADWSFTQNLTQPIQFRLKSRGYSAENDLLFFGQVDADVQTWYPTYSFTTYSSGIETQVAQQTGRTRSRTAYVRSDRADYDLTNVNGDFLSPYRQDYSVSAEDEVVPGAAGIKTNLHQEARDKLPIHHEGRFVQTEVTNTTGRIRVLSLMLRPGVEEAGFGSQPD